MAAKRGARQSGVGFIQHTIDWATRRRCSAFDAFLEPVLAHPKLKVLTQTTVTCIHIERGRATGVDLAGASGWEAALADAEVIVAAGTYMTPKILTLSGIGSRTSFPCMGSMSRPMRRASAGTCRIITRSPIVASTSGAFDYFGEERGLAMLRSGLQYVLFKLGAVTTTGVEACASTDPMALPLVDTEIFADPDDLRLTMAGLRFAREVLAANPVGDMIDRELSPRRDVTTDDDLAEHCRRAVKTNNHPVGTCCMGRGDDPLAVGTLNLRVRGIAGLRIVDASITPTITSGNTNTPVLPIADKAVDIITGYARIVPEAAPSNRVSSMPDQVQSS